MFYLIVLPKSFCQVSSIKQSDRHSGTSSHGIRFFPHDIFFKIQLSAVIFILDYLWHFYSKFSKNEEKTFRSLFMIYLKFNLPEISAMCSRKRKRSRSSIVRTLPCLCIIKFKNPFCTNEPLMTYIYFFAKTEVA